jgi:hypothetical protein
MLRFDQIYYWLMQILPDFLLVRVKPRYGEGQT